MKLRSHGGFTLVEMLVVVAIIGILIGILLPALSGAMARSRDLHCINNVGQHAKALTQYGGANRNRTVSTNNWMLALDRFLSLGPKAEARLCPNATRANTGDGKVDRAWTYQGWVGSIAINYHLAADVPTKDDFTTMSQPDSTTPAFMDGAKHITAPVTAVAWPPNLAGGSSGSSIWCMDRHRKAIAMSYCDGHADRVDLAMVWDKKWNRTFIPQGRQIQDALGIR